MELPRPRAQRKDIEALLADLERRGWRVTRKKAYYMAKCTCPAKHFKTIHLTPSSPYYLTNLTHWFKRQSCWREER